MGPALEGRKALILGASGGMGRAVAAALSEQGITCGLAGRNREKLTSVLAELPKDNSKPEPVILDLADTAGIENAVQSAIRQLGGLDFLIDCAGVHASARSYEADLNRWDEMLDINFRNVVHVLRHALPEINGSPCGAVVAIGSITPPYAGAGMHLAAKRALGGFFEALFEDVRGFGTKICVINPGYVNTSMVSSERLDRSRMIQPEDIAQTVLFVLSMPGTACPTEITIRPQKSPYV